MEDRSPIRVQNENDKSLLAVFAVVVGVLGAVIKWKSAKSIVEIHPEVVEESSFTDAVFAGYASEWLYTHRPYTSFLVHTLAYALWVVGLISKRQ